MRLFRTFNDNNGDINYVASWSGAKLSYNLIADEYHNRLIQIDGELYTLLLIRDSPYLDGNWALILQRTFHR